MFLWHKKYGIGEVEEILENETRYKISFSEKKNAIFEANFLQELSTIDKENAWNEHKSNIVKLELFLKAFPNELERLSTLLGELEKKAGQQEFRRQILLKWGFKACNLSKEQAEALLDKGICKLNELPQDSITEQIELEIRKKREAELLAEEQKKQQIELEIRQKREAELLAEEQKKQQIELEIRQKREAELLAEEKRKQQIELEARQKKEADFLVEEQKKQERLANPITGWEKGQKNHQQLKNGEGDILFDFNNMYIYELWYYITEVLIPIDLLTPEYFETYKINKNFDEIRITMLNYFEKNLDYYGQILSLLNAKFFKDVGLTREYFFNELKKTEAGMYTRFRLGLEPIENISFNILRDDFLTNPEGTFAKYSSIEQRDGALKKHLLTCKKSSKELNEYIKSNSVSFSEEEILEFITASKCNLLYFSPGKEMLEKAAKLNLNEFVYYVIKGATYDRRNILFSINSIQSEETREKVLKALKISAEELTWLKNRLIPIGNIGAGSAFDIPIYDTISEMQRRNEIKKSFKAPKKSNR